MSKKNRSPCNWRVVDDASTLEDGVFVSCTTDPIVFLVADGFTHRSYTVPISDLMSQRFEQKNDILTLLLTQSGIKEINNPNQLLISSNANKVIGKIYRRSRSLI